MPANRRDPAWFGEIVLTAALFAVGAAFRLRHLYDSVRYDEAFTFLTYVRAPLWSTLTNYGAANNHFLNSLLVRWATSVLGDQAALWRLPSLAAGLGMMVLAAVIARRWFGRGAGIAALFVTCVSPVSAHFSVLARGYSLSLFFGLMGLYFADIRHESNRGALASAAAALSFALACYAVPCILPFICAFFAYDAYRTYRRRARATTLFALWLPAALLTALLYLPPLLVSGPGALAGNLGEFVASPFSLGGLRPYVGALVDAKTWGAGGGWFWLPAVAAGFVVGGLKRPAFAVLAGVSLLGGAALLAAGLRPPERIFIYLLPVAALGIGAAAAAAWQKAGGREPVLRVAGVALVALAVAAVGFAERERYLNDSVRSGAAPAARAVVEYLAGNDIGDTLIVSCPLNYPVMYYVQNLGYDTLRILAGRPPQAYTFEAFVAVPTGAPLREVVRDGTGGCGVVLRAAFVTPISDVGLWRALIVCPSPGGG